VSAVGQKGRRPRDRAPPRRRPRGIPRACRGRAVRPGRLRCVRQRRGCQSGSQRRFAGTDCHRSRGRERIACPGHRGRRRYHDIVQAAMRASRMCCDCWRCRGRVDQSWRCETGTGRGIWKRLCHLGQRIIKASLAKGHEHSENMMG
jgi:hypothetical protein